jgi:hypothetical protein
MFSNSKIFPVITLLFTLNCVASVENTFSLGAGFNLNLAPDNNVAPVLDSEISVRPALGLKSMMRFHEKWSLRSAVIAQSKSARFRARSQGINGDLESKAIYASVPLNLQYRVNEDISVFGGYVADVHINDYCTRDGDYKSCDFGRANSLVNVATIGTSVMGATSYQHGLTEAFEGIKIHTLQVMAFYRLE